MSVLSTLYCEKTIDLWIKSGKECRAASRERYKITTFSRFARDSGEFLADLVYCIRFFAVQRNGYNIP